MTIEWRAEDRQFHLHTGVLSQVLRIYEDGSLGQIHLGAPLPPGRSYRHLGPDPFPGWDERVGDPIPMAVPTSGRGDLRGPALVAVGPDGSGTVDLRYRSHRIEAGKPPLEGLPATYAETAAEADTLTIELADEHTGLELELRLTAFAGRPIIARSAVVRAARDAVTLTTALSLALDLPDDDWVLLTLSGAWAREAHPHERALVPGRTGIHSLRGSSGAEHNPALILRRAATDEADGEALAASLVYSGDFLAEVEVDPFGTTRLRLGIHPDTFRWRLAAGEAFVTPEAVVAWTDQGLAALSHALHDLYGRRLARGTWRDRARPIVLNNWEGTYFDFDADRLLEMARAGRELGIELFVLDDGWFGRRDADDRSLGDWVVDRRKLPDGIEGLADRITELGLDFGLWFEPEMVSPDSDLFRAHPDWAVGIPGRTRTTSRHQLVLDTARPDVVDHLESAVTAVLASAPISYVKWDMNRVVTESYAATLPPDRQGEAGHRRVLGVYELYRRLTERFPDVLFESCASGGGRFDPGMLAFAPQAWTSDDTDAIERLAIQWGTSMIYPPSAMAAHVSAVPNHQTGRVTPIDTRAIVAMFGSFGYELDPTRMTDAERERVRDQVALYRRFRETLQYGRFHRLASPVVPGARQAAWMSVSADRSEALVAVVGGLNRPTPEHQRIRLRGLDPGLVYRARVWPELTGDPLAASLGVARTGADLMATGLILDRDRSDAPSLGDFWSRLVILESD